MVEIDVSQDITHLADLGTALVQAASSGKLRRMATPPGLLDTLSERALDVRTAGAFARDIEAMEGLEARLAKALRGSGLCCQSRVATILSQLWWLWGKLGQHEQFIFWLEATHGIRVRMSAQERVALIQKADVAYWQANGEEEASQLQPGEPEDTTAYQQRRRKVAQQAEAAGVKVDWTEDGPQWDEAIFPFDSEKNAPSGIEIKVIVPLQERPVEGPRRDVRPPGQALG